MKKNLYRSLEFNYFYTQGGSCMEFKNSNADTYGGILAMSLQSIRTHTVKFLFSYGFLHCHVM